MIAEYGNSGELLRRYIHGPGIDNPIACVKEAVQCIPGAIQNGPIFMLKDSEAGKVIGMGPNHAAERFGHRLCGGKCI